MNASITPAEATGRAKYTIDTVKTIPISTNIIINITISINIIIIIYYYHYYHYHHHQYDRYYYRNGCCYYYSLLSTTTTTINRYHQ